MNGTRPRAITRDASRSTRFPRGARRAFMRVVLADLKGTTGFVSKASVACGYGSRLRPFSRGSSIMGQGKRRLHAPPSVQMAYLAALAAERGHDVTWTPDAPVDGDVALVLSSLVDYKAETAWADTM